MNRCLPAVLFAAVSLTSGCAHLQSVSMTPLPTESGTEVFAEVESPVIIAFTNPDHDYVDDLKEDLASQCAGGRVEGLMTKNEEIWYWGSIIYKVRVSANGTCIRDEAPNS